MKQSLTEQLQVLGGAIGAIIGAITGIAVGLQNAKKAIEDLSGGIDLPLIIWLSIIFALLLVVGGIWLVIRGLAPKSRLLRPERLLIDPDNPDHLRGRDVELRRLAEAVTAQPLIFLEGESGAGKSALVRSGLIPALLDPPGARPARTMLPVYLNGYGGDWAQGLQERLVDAFWYWLGPDLHSKPPEEVLRQALGDWCRKLDIRDRDTLRSQLLISGTSPLLKRIRTELGWIPLLIFDQFDDYQVANRKHFLRDGRWIKADELVAANPVWQCIRQEIEHGSLHLLFITRRDLVAGLEAVRFGNPECYALDRVESTFIGALLDDLTAPVSKDQPVISHPNAGWDSLKRRLVNDLSEQHRILPIQARVAFRGLTRLPVLNTAAYQRHGGIEGLEAAHVEDATGTAARAAGLTRAQTLALLLDLVDDSDPDAPKARSLPAADLAAASGIGRERSDQVLSVLDQEGIVRRRAGNGTDGSPVWSLYHDYLARAVIAAHRRANRWQRLLKERRQALEGAGSWVSHWRNLLSPWEQLRLLGATLARKVRWSGYRRFAVFSGLRWLPLLMLVVLTWVGTDQALQWQARQGAHQILTAIRGGSGYDEPTGEEYRNLWTLASSTLRRKRAFLEQSILDTRSHTDLLEHLEPVAQSLFGLDPDLNLRQQALELAFRHKPATPYQAKLAALVYQSAPDTFAARTPRIAERIPDLMQATTNSEELEALGKMLADLGAGLPAAQAQSVALRLVEIMGTTTDPRQLSPLGEALGKLGEGLPAAQAQAGALRLVEIMGTTTDPRQLSRLGEALGKLGEWLPTAQVQSVALRLVEVMGTTDDPEKLSQLSAALGGLGERLPAEQAQAGALRLVEVIDTTTEPYQLNALVEALGKLGERLPAAQAQSVALRLVEIMGTTTEPWQLSWLGGALGKLGEQLPAAQAQSGALRLVEVMGTTTDPRQLSWLGKALGKLGERLPAAQAQSGALRLVEVMGTTTDLRQLSRLGEALGKLGEGLPAKQARNGALRLVEVMSTTTEPWQLSELGEVLGELGKGLPAEQAQSVALRLVEVMDTTTEPSQLSRLVKALGKLGEGLPAAQAQSVALRLVEIIGTTTDRWQLSRLGKELGERLPAAQAQSVALRLVEVMGTTTDPEKLSPLGEVLGELGEGLPAEQAQSVALRLVEVMSTIADPDQFSRFGVALGGLGDRLPAEQAQSVALRLVEIMITITDQWQLRRLGEALGKLGEGLPAAQAQAVALRLVEIMGTTTDPWQLSPLGEALGKLGEGLPAAQAQAGALRLVEVMGTTTEPDQLSWLGEALGKLGEGLPAAQAQVGASRLVEVMGLPITPDDFVSLAASLGDLPIAKDAAGAGIDTAPDLLQAPMAFDKDSWSWEPKTREQLLRYYSRLAGVFETAEAFRTTDDLVAWVREHRPSLDLTRPPRNPFR